MPLLFKKMNELKNKSLLNSSCHDTITTEEDTNESFNFTTRRVRFSSSVRQRTILNIDDYSERERKQTWQDKEDKAEMTKNHDKIFRRYEMGKVCMRNMSYRGLDCWTEKGANKIGATIDRLISTVMDEQDDQWKRGIVNPDRLAETSMFVSRLSVLQALRMAEEDEYEAQEANKDTFAEENASDEDSIGTRSTLLLQKRKVRRRSGSTNKKDRSRKNGERKRPSIRRQSS